MKKTPLAAAVIGLAVAQSAHAQTLSQQDKETIIANAGCKDNHSDSCVRFAWSLLPPQEKEQMIGICTWDPRVNSATTPPITTDEQYWQAWRLWSEAQKATMQRACDRLRNAEA